MASSLRDELLGALTPEAQRYALRLNASAGMGNDDPSWLLIASAARVMFPPRPSVRHQWPGWALILITISISIVSLMLAAWIGARGWAGYLESEIHALELRRDELKYGTPPAWATFWTTPVNTDRRALFVRDYEIEDIELSVCRQFDKTGVCISLRE